MAAALIRTSEEDGAGEASAHEPLRLESVPVDVLCLFMDSVLPPWSRRTGPHGPRWLVGDLQARLDLAGAVQYYRALALVSRRMFTTATPYLYRLVHLRDVAALMSLWRTLSSLRPSHAAYIRHLVVGVPLTEHWSDFQAQSWIWSRNPPAAELAAAHPSREPCDQPIRWADGRPLRVGDLLSGQDPNVAHRICFDVVARALYLQSLAVAAPIHNPLEPSVALRASLSVSAAAGVTAQAMLRNELRVLTLHVRGSCHDYLSVYGSLVLPRLSRLILISEGQWCILGLHDSDGRGEATVLERVRSVCVPWARDFSCSRLDLRLGLEEMPRAESVTIFTPPTVFDHDADHAASSSAAAAATAATDGDDGGGGDDDEEEQDGGLANINQQLGAHGRHLRHLDLRWAIELPSSVWLSLGPTRRLACLASLESLVVLEVSTQMLFGTLERLEARLRAPPRERGSVAQLLRRLPGSLQVVSLTEFWPRRERGLLATSAEENLDMAAEMIGDDWIAAFLRDDAAAAEGPQPPHHMILSVEDRAVLALMRLLCGVWLAGGRASRKVELRPQSFGFYESYTHKVLLATEGLEGLVPVRKDTLQGCASYEYSFVPVVYLRGCGFVLPRRQD